MRFADVYAGIGGFRLGVGANGRCVWSCEIDDQAAKVYEWNFAKVSARDIRTVLPERIPDFDLLCAGFPCQPFSIARTPTYYKTGQPSGLGDLSSGDLFAYLVQILRVKQPRAFLFENVPHLRYINDGQDWAEMAAAVEDAGYHMMVKEIDSALVVPQHRNRLYMIGFRDKADQVAFNWPIIRDEHWTVADILEPDFNVDEKYDLSHKSLSRFQRQDHWRLTVADPNGKTRTLTANYDKSRKEIVIERPDGRLRMLTPRECARLMGFPWSFDIVVSNSAAYSQFGNSVVVPVIRRLVTSITEAFAVGGTCDDDSSAA